jgi:hypothetical protein
VKSELFLLAVTNIVDKDTFYEAAGERDQRFRELVHAAVAADADWVARFVPWLRGTANLRSASALALALAAGPSWLGGREEFEESRPALRRNASSSTCNVSINAACSTTRAANSSYEGAPGDLDMTGVQHDQPPNASTDTPQVNNCSASPQVTGTPDWLPLWLAEDLRVRINYRRNVAHGLLETPLPGSGFRPRHFKGIVPIVVARIATSVRVEVVDLKGVLRGFAFLVGIDVHTRIVATTETLAEKDPIPLRLGERERRLCGD